MKLREKYNKCLFALLISALYGAPASAQNITEQRSVDTLTNASLFHESTAVSFDRSLMGNLPGAFTQSNGLSGGAGLTMLRGVNTVYLNSSPYVFVDGAMVKMSRGLSPFASGYEINNVAYINPMDIEEVSIFNQASLLSQFGGKAGNGILSVETKKGELGPLMIDFTARTGIQQISMYDADMMGASDFRAYLFDYMSNMGTSIGDLTQMDIFDVSHNKYNSNTNWANLIKKETSVYQDYNVSLRGGDGDTRYYFALGYTSSEGEYQTTGYDRFSMRVNLDYRVTPKVSLASYLSYSYGSSKFLGMGTDLSTHPLFVSLTKSPFFSPEDYSSTGIALDRPAGVDELGKSNPELLLTNIKNVMVENRIDEVMKANWNMNANNSLHAMLSLTYTGASEDLNRLSDGVVVDENRVRQNAKRSYSDFILRFNAWYNHKGVIGDALKYNASVGISAEDEEERMVYGRKVNAPTDDFESLGLGDIDSLANLNYSHKLISTYVNGGITYKDLLAVRANAYMEGSSNFGSAGRWNLYGGVDFDAKLLSTDQSKLLFLGGWNRVGNYDIRGSYQHTLFSPAQYTGIGGVYLGNIANEDISPEMTDNYELGLAYNLGRNLSLGATYYYRNTSDLLTQKAAAIELGLDPQFSNDGSVVNKGVEANINLSVINNKDVALNFFANISTLSNEVSNLTNGSIIQSIDRFTSITENGSALGSFYGYKVNGVFAKESDVNLRKSDGSPYEAGDYIMNDLDKNGTINSNDREVIGSPLPDFFGGFGGSFTYKKLTVSALFSYSYGNDVYNLFEQSLSAMSDLSVPLASASNRWISEANPGDGSLPRAAFNDPSGNFSTSDRWVEDGSYIKFKQLSFSYKIPLKNQNHIKGLDVYLNCNNLFTWSKYSGNSPDVFSSWSTMFRGVDTGVVSEPRSIVLGLKLSL